MSQINRQWQLAKRPTGMVTEDCFELVESSVPDDAADLEEGQILVRNKYLAFEPAMRGWIEDVPSYLPPVGIGEVMRASAAGEVIASNHADYAVGDRVSGLFGWQEYALLTPGGLTAATPVPEGLELTDPLSRLGMTSITAYFGLLDVGQPKAGETVVVTGAAGATGSVAAQIARIKGCRVIGVAGGPEKCAWLREEAKLDAVIDYKNESVIDRLGELCPDGIDVAFDNVGGEQLDAILFHIAERGRITLCGMISGYNNTELEPQLRNIGNMVKRRVRMQGFIVLDYLGRVGEAFADLTKWVGAGEIAYQTDIQHGMENVPKTFLRLFSGANLGKQLLELD
ncbi:MAG: NADP-dependent oxidoreductase [Myxococcota bacterium]|nr:NADP-dependent oxidoreductase [Myxococcota bacterium]